MAKISRWMGVAILFAGAGTIAWGWSSVGAADRTSPAASGAKTPEAVRSLQKERLATLESIRDLLTKQLNEGTGNPQELQQVELDVLRARLELTDSPHERVSICEQVVENAEAFVKRAERTAELGIGSRSDLLRAKVGVFDAKIALEREKASAN